MRKTTGAVVRHFLWDGDNLLAELDGAGTGKLAEYSYYPGLDHPHALIVGTAKSFAQRDGLGNVIALTDSTQGLKRTYEYDDWGALTGGGDPGGLAGKDRARFKGALWVGDEVELYYMRARWYEPKTGRFLSEDPIGLEGGINPYVYAGNDPINRSDPTGNRGCPAGSYPTAVMPVVVDGVYKGEHVVCMSGGGAIVDLIPVGEYTGTPPRSSRGGGRGTQQRPATEPAPRACSLAGFTSDARRSAATGAKVGLYLGPIIGGLAGAGVGATAGGVIGTIVGAPTVIGAPAAAIGGFIGGGLEGGFYGSLFGALAGPAVGAFLGYTGGFAASIIEGCL